jgi:hypothetical protein
MALFKEISTDCGLLANYWKITNLHFNEDKSCTVTISGFADKSARDFGKTIMKEFTYNIPENTVNNTFALNEIYNFIKTQPDFSFNTLDI